MTFGVALLWLLTCAAGASVAGLVRLPLRLEERAAVAIVAGVALGRSAAWGPPWRSG